VSAINDGGPAFPCEEQIRCNGEVIDFRKFTGMTLRDWFAGQALSGELTNYPTRQPQGDQCHSLATKCYELADAMLKAREVKP